MSKRAIRDVRGSVHDVARLKTMGTEPCNIVAISDTTLNMIQNYAIDEATFTSRFGVNFAGGKFEPISEEDEDFEFVLDVIRRFRQEVSDMSCDLVAAIDALIVAINSTSQVGCGNCGSEVDPEGLTLPDIGPGEPFETQGDYDEFKCRAANWILSGVIDVFAKLQEYDVEFWAETTIALASALVGSILATTLVGGPFTLVAGAVIAFVTALILGATISLADIEATVLSIGAELVCSMFNAEDPEEARLAISSDLSDDGLNSAEVALVLLLLNNSVLNALFEFNSEIDVFPITEECTLCPCDTPDFLLNIGTLVSGALNVDGVPFTVEGELSGGFSRCQLFMYPVGSCPCANYNCEIVSSDPAFVQHSGGLIKDCDDVDVWRWNVQGYDEIIDTWQAYLIDISNTTQSDFVISITRI